MPGQVADVTPTGMRGVYGRRGFLDSGFRRNDGLGVLAICPYGTRETRMGRARRAVPLPATDLKRGSVDNGAALH